MNITRGLKAAFKALLSGPDPRSFRAGDRSIRCPHCQSILFYDRKVSLSTSFSAITNTEWADSEAAALVCSNCSRIEWFLDDPEVDNS